MGIWGFTDCGSPWVLSHGGGTLRAPPCHRRRSSRPFREVVSLALRQAGAAPDSSELRASGQQFSKWLQMWCEIMRQDSCSERTISSPLQLALHHPSASTQDPASSSQGPGSGGRDVKRTLVKKEVQKKCCAVSGGCNHGRFTRRFCWHFSPPGMFSNEKI